MDQQLEDYLCKVFPYDRQVIIEQLDWIKLNKFRGKEEAYPNYLQKTKRLFIKLYDVNGFLLKPEQPTVHLKPPLEKLELGEFYFQAGITTPGTLSVKFAKLDAKTQTLCEQSSTIPEEDYETAFTLKYFQDLRDSPIHGDVMFRILVLGNCGHGWTKVQSKNVLVQTLPKKKVPVIRSFSAPIETRRLNLPEYFRELNVEQKNKLINGLKRDTYLVGKDYISFATHLGVYSEDEKTQFQHLADPAKCIIEDLMQTKPDFKVDDLVKILEFMKRNDIVREIRESRPDFCRSIEHAPVNLFQRQKALSDPQELRLWAVENDDSTPLVNVSECLEGGTHHNYSDYCSGNKVSNQSSSCKTHDPVYPGIQEVTSDRLDIPAHQGIQQAVSSPLDNPAYPNIQQAVPISLRTGTQQAAVPSTLSNPPYPGIQQAVSNAPENLSTNAGEYHNPSQKTISQTMPKELVIQQYMHQNQSPDNGDGAIEESHNMSYNTQQNSKRQSNSSYPNISGTASDTSGSMQNSVTNDPIAPASEATNSEIGKNMQPEGDLSLNSVVK